MSSVFGGIGGPETGGVRASAVSFLLVKSSGGSLVDGYALNETTTAGFFCAVDANAEPATGDISGILKEALPLPGSAVASLSFQPNPEHSYSNGIVLLVTSAALPTTYTKGVITAFIKGRSR